MTWPLNPEYSVFEVFETAAVFYTLYRIARGLYDRLFPSRKDIYR